MKCEICHKADAETAVHLKGKDGGTRELYVCHACAEAAKRTAKSKRRKRSNGKSFTVSGDRKEAPSFVKNFFEAALGLVNGLEGMSDDSSDGQPSEKCPGCKTSWEAVEKKHMLGCPQCWTTFAGRIRRQLLSGAWGPSHKGSMPDTAEGESTRSYLERELAAAVAAQDYEKAAQIQRRLKELGGDAAVGGGE